MSDISSTSRALSGFGLALVMIALGASVAAHFLLSWATLSANFPTTIGSVVTVTLDYGLWKYCGSESILVFTASGCEAHGHLDYVKGLLIGSQVAGLIAFMLIIGAFNSRACQVLAVVFAMLQGMAMAGAVGRFAYNVTNQLNTLVADSFGILSWTYGLAFYGVCAGCGAAILAAIFMAIARGSANSGEQQNDQINLVHVIKA